MRPVAAADHRPTRVETAIGEKAVVVVRRWVSVLALVLAISFTVSTTANAGVLWCFDDPIVTVEGREFQMITGFPASELGSLVGPVNYFVRVPANAKVTVAYPPSLVPSKVYIVRTGDRWSGDAAGELSVQVTVLVLAKTQFEFRTNVFGPAVGTAFTVSGRSNFPTTFDVDLR